ncbi:hypothetical protein ACLK10_01845 [Escherichia coli]
MEEVAQELRLRGAYVELKSLPPEEGQQLGHLDLLVHMGEEQNFVYQIWPQQYSVPGFTYRARSRKSTYYRLETFLLEGSQGNDLMDYSKEQVITDILDEYERHLNFIHLHREAPGHSVSCRTRDCYCIKPRHVCIWRVSYPEIPLVSLHDFIFYYP